MRPESLGRALPLQDFSQGGLEGVFVNAESAAESRELYFL